MSRIPLIGQDEAGPEVTMMYGMLEENFGKVPNIFATAAQYPLAMGPLLQFFDALYAQSELPPRLLEMVVIKVSFGFQSHYCLTLHKAFALERGLSHEDILAIADPKLENTFSAAERVVIEYVGQYAADSLQISDELQARLREHFDEAEIVNLCLLASLSTLFGQFANALQIPIDDFIGAPPPAGV